MPQFRLEHYFTASRPPCIQSGRSFLDLPPHVRRLVYEYAELGSQFIDLNYTNLLVYPHGEYPETRGCCKVQPFESYSELRKLDVVGWEELWEMDVNSLEQNSVSKSIWNKPWGGVQAMNLVCRDVHREVETYIHSTSIFRVCLGQPLGFSRLERMSETALSHLTKLTIRLDQTRYEVQDDPWGPNPPEHIDLSKRWSKKILRDWMRKLDLLVRTLRPQTLRLNVIFRARALRDAKAILEPLVRLPLLRGCGICVDLYGQNRFWKKEVLQYSQIECWQLARADTDETDISRLAQHIIKKVTMVESTISVPFRYPDLPQEIRLSILGYTNLISPDAVRWRPRNRGLQGPPCRYCDDAGNPVMIDNMDFCCRISNNDFENTMQFRCCEQCSPNDDSGICYCSSRPAVWSSSCACHHYRHTLFWVSRQVRYDALAVYYQSNKIFVTPLNSASHRYLYYETDFRYSWRGVSGLSQVELSLYLSSISGHALQHIRWLEWMLPSAGRGYLLPGTRAWQDYLDTILLMENAMNLPALTLTINMSLSRCLPTDSSSWIWWETIVLPFSRLGGAGLKDFFVNLTSRIMEGRRAHHERDLERAVMGTTYDSRKRSKPEERIHYMLREM
ncbi:hypothetical protein DE146DRAFT_279556 [Phaeosphaeria sp. MPI-PUGE-AT-0046c]|nr:hypothetical protein DE146DRAFT_279556 [Phaeosphaeria sp. MPI-PUGE-AT-0046c]